MIQWDWALYSVPARLAGASVWVRRHGDDIVITHPTPGRPGRPRWPAIWSPTPGNRRVDPDHFPPAPETPLARQAVPKNAAEADFLAIGEGAVLWLKEAGEIGVSRVRAKMAQAVSLSKLAGTEAVNWALGHAAIHGRFGEGDLVSILDHASGGAPPTNRSAGEDHSLQAGTARWEGFGRCHVERGVRGPVCHGRRPWMVAGPGRLGRLSCWPLDI